MSRFIIRDGLPYLYVHGKAYACRFDEKGFAYGAEVELTEAPSVTYPELSIRAKCADLDSIKAVEGKTEQPVEFNEMTVEELKAFAKEHEIKLGTARTKDAIIAAISDAL